MIPREVTSKQESNNDGEVSMPSSSSTTSWSKLKDPRIVRVSRAFGGKDRHSKVCTVKGLRDRRVRLSVPTAIQLYDLQERLGLNQPSKVVDWLLTAAKNEIDELPPLQIPQGSFMMMQSLHQSHDDHNQFLAASLSAKQGLKISDQSGKFKDASRENITSDRNHEAWERQFNHDQNYFLSSSRQHINNPSNSLLSLLNNNNSSPFLRWDSSNLTLSHPPISLGLADHHNHDHQHDDQDLQNFSLLQFPSSLSTATPSGSHHQVLVYQPGITTQPYFPSQIEEFDSKQSNFQSSELSDSSQTHVRPLHFSMTANLFPSQNNAVNEENRHNELHRS